MPRKQWVGEVIGSEFTVYGADNGKGWTAVCHGASQHYTQRNNAARRPIDSRTFAFWQSVGIARTETDGSMSALCILSGEWLPLCDAEGKRYGTAGTISLGHDWPDSRGGAWCACNLLPVEVMRNKSMGTDTFATMRLAYPDPRPAFRAWFASNASASQVARIQKGQ